MSEEKKSFFERRTVAEIRGLDVVKISESMGLTDRLVALNPVSEGLVLDFAIILERFYENSVDSADASRKALKHGVYVPLKHPRTQYEACNSRRNPLSYRVRDLEFLSRVPEEQIIALGYSFRPVQGNDRRQRRVPFVAILEAGKLMTYAQNKTAGIEVIPYADAHRVAREGAEVVVNIPSRTKKKQRYRVKFGHIPVVDNAEKRAIVWSFCSTYEEGKEVPHDTFMMRYTPLVASESSDVDFVYPQDIVGYWATVGHFTRRKNYIPWEMDPFAKPSQLAAELHTKMENNVLIIDRNTKRPRHLHLAERSILLARAVGVLGHDAILFWQKGRDPAFKNYNWHAHIEKK